MKKLRKLKIGAIGSMLALTTGLGFSTSASASAEPFIGEIQMVGFGFAPRGWAMCDGQLLAISQNSALFSLLGTTYGGDGRTSFGLPDLRGRVAIHPGQGPGLSRYTWGQRGGVESVVLNTNQIPSHSHSATTTLSSLSATLKGTSERGNSSDPTDKVAANSGRDSIYKDVAPNVDMHADAINISGSATTTVGNTGGTLSHENRMPYLAICHVIALQGIFPSRS